MKGVVAAGSRATAEAGAEILRRGGNAVDAAVAACFATSAGEPVLTSLAGAGVMIHRDGQTGGVEICDFFANTPGLGLGGERPELAALDFFGVDLHFGPTTQVFHIGRGAAAVPGVLPGLCAALDRWGSLPLTEVIAPACRQMREGVVIGPWQAVAVHLLTPILLHTEAGRRQFGVDGAPDATRTRCEHDVYKVPWLADTLEDLASRGWPRFHDEVFAPLVLAEFGPEAGGLITAEDLESFEVVFREPLSFDYRGRQVYTNPPPALGGSMIGLMLSLLDDRDAADLPPLGSVERTRLLGHAMRLADEARQQHGRLADGSGLGLDPGVVARGRELLERDAETELVVVEDLLGGPTSTTHISVIDGAGDAAAVTFSYGEGGGYLIGDTGIMMNNLMGEADLHPKGFHQTPAGQRLATMMSPSIIVGPDGALTALGTGGANRIRSALVQVISNLIDEGLTPQEATSAARCHFEAGVLNVEVHQMDPAARGAGLDSLGATKVVRFDQPNLFFGGVHLVRRGPDGGLTGGGDPRRGGAVRLVE